ncbi:MAG TPA: hypothetical protein VIS52_00955, partial [Motiliproteus sp.]
MLSSAADDADSSDQCDHYGRAAAADAQRLNPVDAAGGIIAGLLLSVLFSLVLIPVLYTLLTRQSSRSGHGISCEELRPPGAN